jgi:hypothetical protein
MRATVKITEPGRSVVTLVMLSMKLKASRDR